MSITAGFKLLGRSLDAADDMLAAGKHAAGQAFNDAAREANMRLKVGTEMAAKQAAPHVLKAGKVATDATLTGIGLGADIGVKGTIAGLTASNKILEKTVGKAGNGLANFAWNHLSPGKLVKYDEEHGYRLNKKGKLAIGGLILGSGALSGVDEREKVHMGAIDPRIRTATPDYSAYAKMKTPKTTYSPAPAGADGSLVFALDQAKNGGFL